MADHTPAPGPNYTQTSIPGRLPMPPRIPIQSPLGFPTSHINTAMGPLPLPNPNTWTYDSRHTTQPLLPGLLVGPSLCAKNPSFLHSAQISLAIGLRASTAPFALAALAAVDRACAAAGTHSVTIPAESSAALIRAFDAVNDLLANHVGANVLLHCETGNDRAACAGAAYLCFSRGVEYRDAITYVQGCRFSAVFDEERRRLLQAYWDVLVARRGVGGGHVGRGKRGRDDEGEEDAREGATRAPFADV